MSKELAICKECGYPINPSKKNIGGFEWCDCKKDKTPRSVNVDQRVMPKITVVRVAHILEGIDDENYDIRAWNQTNEKLKKEIKQLYNVIDIKNGDCITVLDNDGDMNFYTVHHRAISFDKGKLDILYWMDDLR